jgi:hypothetical protein
MPRRVDTAIRDNHLRHTIREEVIYPADLGLCSVCGANPRMIDAEVCEECSKQFPIKHPDRVVAR